MSVAHGLRPGQPVADGWAEAVANARRLADDPVTLRAWARGIGVSRSSLRALCYAAGTRPRDSLDVVRLLRAVVLAAEDGAPPPRDYLTCADPRAFQRLLRRAGFATAANLPPEPAALLTAQRLVTHRRLLELVVARVSASR